MRYDAIALLLAAIVGPELRYFSSVRPILGTPEVSSQACLALDASSFSGSAKGLADLRLYRDTVETPYTVRIAAPVQAGGTSVRLLNLGLHGTETAFDAAMPVGSYSDLVLGIAGQDFIATVTVFGSQSQGAGIPTKLGSYTVFDLSRQKLGRSTVLHLPDSDFRYLHFQIDGPVKPESITSLTVDKLSGGKPRYQPVAASFKITKKDRSTVVVFTVPARVPVDRIGFDPGSAPAMFNREVRVDVEPIVARPVSDDAEARPGPISFTGNLLRVHSTEEGHRIDEERLTIDAPSTSFDTATQWTVSIQNGDDAPLSLTAIRLEMLERDLCFEAVGEAHYALYYGDDALPPPVYDYSTMFTVRKDAVQVTLSPERRNPSFQARPDTRPFTEKHPALLWVGLITVVALLGGIALRSASGDGRARPL